MTLRAEPESINENLSEENKKRLQDLTLALGYTFKNPEILALACIHKSFGNEQRPGAPISQRDNEQLEFLGDAVLDFVITQMLLKKFPDYTEGQLSKLRAGLVNEKLLSKIARELDLGKFILLGKGEEQTGGRDKDSILASTFEALVAAVFNDGGYQAAETLLLQVFEERITSSTSMAEFLDDFKTKLQELAQARYKTAPRYEVISSTGPDHDKTFKVQIVLMGKIMGSAEGKNKKDAEQLAAKFTLDLLASNQKKIET